jgi:LmbE family N-acetylglucosaminyl deacetylase
MRPKTLVVASPHRDDAALSAGLIISRWAARNWPVTIVNCFTVSDYAPNRPGLNALEVTKLRRQEDESFASALGGRAQFADLGLLDAPLRLQCSSDVVCGFQAAEKQLAETVESVATAMAPFVGEILLAPLAIGDHIDHLVVRRACSSFIRSALVAFYEDLPYAGAADAGAIAAAISAIESASDVVLEGVIVPAANAVSRKMRLVHIYSSQLSGDDEAQIASHTLSLAGERFWADPRARAVLQECIQCN